jgi:hypothetical protein
MTRQIDSRKIIDMVTTAFKYQMQLAEGPALLLTGQEAWLDERGLGLGGKLRGIANVLGKPSPCWRQRVPTEERAGKLKFGIMKIITKDTSLAFSRVYDFLVNCVPSLWIWHIPHSSDFQRVRKWETSTKARSRRLKQGER